MSGGAPIYNYESDVGNALRRAADATTPEEQRSLLHLFASYLETEFDRAAGRAQTAIGNVEIKVREQVAETHTMVQALGVFLQEQRNEQRQQFEELLAGQAGLQVEVGQQIAQLGQQIGQLAERQDRLDARSEEHDRLIARLAERQDRLDARSEEHDRLIARLAERVAQLELRERVSGEQ